MNKDKKLVFLDIDGTLLKPDYKPNSTQLPALLKRLERQGFIFAINSNRSRADLIPVAKKFGIRGPLVGENGIFYRWQNKDRMLVKAKPIREVIDGPLKRLAQECDAQIRYTDTVAAEDSKRKYARGDYWLVNKFRKYTASIHVLSRGRRDLTQARSLASKLRKLLPKSYEVRASPVFANVLIYPKSSDKKRAINPLKKLIGSRITYAIGDDEADLGLGKFVNHLLAVGNATPQLKRQAAIIADKPYTQGVVELLKKLSASTRA